MFSVEPFRRAIDYDHETGRLVWKVRDIWFVDQGLQTDRGMKSFNTQFAGKDAFTTVDRDGYRTGYAFGKFVRAHRVAFAIYHGAWPKMTVDHINRIKTDNRIENLRDASRSDQATNRGLQKNNVSGCPGVHWCGRSKKWIARIRSTDGDKMVGAFDLFADAEAAILKARAAS